MAHYKRGRSRRQVRCTMCTEHRWKGNNGRGSGLGGRLKSRDQARLEEMKMEILQARGERESA